jgi:endonuclease/exonuclease/phosphatase family metal-dependent hydrolase
VRLATYNVQWFDHLFDRGGQLRSDEGRTGREDVSAREQVEALGLVFRALDADAIVVVEAPDARRGERAIESFARRFSLRAREAVMGFPSGTQQEITLLFDPDRLGARHDPRSDPGVPRFDGTFRADPGDGQPGPVAWSKPPLEVALRTPSGAPLRLIGVHAKSKTAHGARSEAQARRVSLENRRKQIAQCLWLRARVDAHLARGESLVVLGDFNDGPGQDEYEEAFNRSGLEVVLGEGDATRLLEPHARLATAAGPTGAQPSSARFRLPAGPEGGARWLSALLDYAMASPDLGAARPRWRIWHPFDDDACWRDERLRAALLHASDHFPVTLDLDL